MVQRSVSSTDRTISDNASWWCDPIFSTLMHRVRLHELSDAWQQVDSGRHVNNFLPLASIDATCTGYRHCLEVAIANHELLPRCDGTDALTEGRWGDALASEARKLACDICRANILPHYKRPIRAFRGNSHFVIILYMV